ncbi:Scr1 family TA system antitoxin-like transcriptional regulator [Lentzea albidocapillata]|uniref:Helix-turn-helix domain-containing protein n=1 Tax=Lentzea albidocapillata TaxID=40571 RepID=A0A1W2CKP6_9PSEU|nr:Scr1 family TA system antitoxin-like transcriptional regulator [Lentzea albidocapillata]SMC85554.1 Helix-turn-helix domain-containing protein [Lentzea albidocapillata]
MKNDFRASMAERSVGRVLRRWRDNLGLSLAEASAKARFSSAKLSMIENAVQPLDPLDIMVLGHVYGVPNDVWKQEVRRAEPPSSKRAIPSTPTNSLTLNAAEDVDEVYLEAATLRVFGADIIPRCLQTPGYRLAAREMGRPTYAADDAARRAEVHESWIERLSAPKSQRAVEVLLTKDALRRVAGDPDTTNAALVQLVQLSELERFTVQVLAHESHLDTQQESSYVHLGFPHRQHNDVVYVEDASNCQYVEDPTVCRLIQQGFKALQRTALDPSQSVELIAEIASSLTFDPSDRARVRAS